MIFKEYKYEIIIGAGIAFLFSSLFLNILSWTPKKTGLLNNVSFEMVRPGSDFRNEYSLEKREIDKEFINPFKKKEATKISDNNKENPNLVPVKNQIAKKQNKKAKSKKEDTKKGMSVSIVNRNENKGLTPSDNENANYNQRNYTNDNNLNNSNPKQPPPTDEERQAKKSASDFLDLATKPTSEKIQQLILAYKNGDLAKEDFYQIVNAMLTSENLNSQSYGVYLCYTFSSVESFSIVTLSFDRLNDKVKPYANEFLHSFNHQAKIQYLGQALQSNNIKIVMKAGEIIILGLQKVKNGQNIYYAGRDGRGNNDITSTKFFEFLLPIAENLKKSTNQTLASVGNSISQEIGEVPKTN